MSKRNLLLLALIAIAIPAAGLITWYCSRDWLLQRKLDQWTARIGEADSIEISISPPRWTGLTTFEIDRIEIRKGKNNATLIVKGIDAKPSLWAYLWNGVKFNELKIDSLWMEYSETSAPQKISLGPREFFAKKWIEKSKSLEKLSSVIQVQFAQIRFDSEERGAKAQWECKDFLLRCEKTASGSSKLSIHSDFSGLALTQKLLADAPLHFAAGKFSISCFSSGEEWILDPASEIQIGKAKFNLFASLPSHANQEIVAGIRLHPVSQEELFASFPEGAFEQIKSIGNKNLHSGYLALSAVPSRENSFRWKGNVLEIPANQIAKESFAGFLNYSFTYQPEGSDRKIVMGPSSRSWCPLNEIPLLTRQCVLYSEDPDFFHHKGVNPDFLLRAARENLEENKFTRGGSTITMQLVKNIFLSRGKTICRKAEEIALSCLLESSGQVSKERILELYLNLAEWGPGIYGIREASQFYFKKNPDGLSADESIFLAGLLPNPRMYQTQFDASGNPKEFVLAYFDGMKLNLFDQDLITGAELEKPVALKLRQGI